MNFFNLAKKHFVLFWVIFLAFGCSFNLGKKTTSEPQTKQRQIKNDDFDHEKPTRPTIKNNDGNPQELVGKWCYLSNVQANGGGGRMSNTCVTLNSDGTYEYYSETSSSNPYGGTNSQESDAGRWSATATTITSNSNKGETKTFTLEKRNHPKTNDPMLMIDGQAFVTANQKQPW